MRTFLETEHLILREFEPDDVDNLVDLNSDPAVLKYLTGGVPISREETEMEDLPAFLEYHRTSERYGFWAMIEKTTGDFVGWVHFRPNEGDPPGQPELGYRLKQKFWGKGYAPEASRAVIDRGFREFGVNRVTAGTMAVNMGSRRVMEKCGMRFHRAFFQDWPYEIEGSEHGDVEYELTRAQWEMTQPAPQSTESS